MMARLDGGEWWCWMGVRMNTTSYEKYLNELLMGSQVSSAYQKNAAEAEKEEEGWKYGSVRCD